MDIVLACVVKDELDDCLMIGGGSLATDPGCLATGAGCEAATSGDVDDGATAESFDLGLSLACDKIGI